MIEHSHHVQICARCIAVDLRVVLRRLQEHNLTLLATQATLYAERTLNNTIGMIDYAEDLISQADGRPSPQADLG